MTEMMQWMFFFLAIKKIYGYTTVAAELLSSTQANGETKSQPSHPGQQLDKPAHVLVEQPRIVHATVHRLGACTTVSVPL